MGRQVKPLIIMLLALAGVVMVLLGAETLPPDMRHVGEEGYNYYYARLERQVETYPGDPRSMYNQYQIGMYHLQRGDLDRARLEFEKVILNYPYMEYEYGWIMDDARMRIKEIDRERARHQRIQEENWYLPEPPAVSTIP